MGLGRMEASGPAVLGVCAHARARAHACVRGGGVCVVCVCVRALFSTGRN